MADPVISLLSDLVAIDSVNPSLVAGAAGEAQIADAVETHMRAIGLDVHRQDVAPGRPNVIGVLEGSERGRSLMFCGHIDTVGVAGMQSPFTPMIREGRLYGRGAQDMKAGVAAMIDAARVAQADGFRRGRLVIAAVVDEEYASIGADALVREWKADAAVVTEPTDLQIGVGHKGFAWATIETRGRAAHGSRPAEGRDAILRMGRVLARLEQLDRELQSRKPHPLVGTGSLHTSIIEGGRELSSYPDLCRLQLERRTVPGESAHTFAREMSDLVNTLRDADPELDASVELMFSRPPYELPSSHDLPRALEAAAATAGARSSNVGMSFWTDAAILGEAGIPSVLFGPGGAGLHSREEYVVVNEVTICRDALAGLAKTWP
ncbi:MAG TPA: ArgE/DapE family deacylase [Vicinamibacterales bacterium]|jgi:acetylornithine deacetylase|nr:ArgE/DapE family deacylase [Vicinamibacterales bacterium]